MKYHKIWKWNISIYWNIWTSDEFLNFGILTDYQTGISPITKKVNIMSEYFRISATGKFAKKYYEIIGFKFNYINK